MTTVGDRTSILGVAIRDLSRLQKVTTTVALHGFGEIVMRSPLRRFVSSNRKKLKEAKELEQEPAPERFRKLLEALGPTYVKLGQILSMRPDRIPPEYIAALQQLQDNAAVLPFDEIRKVVEEGLGRPLEETFDSFDTEPLATASIAQIHRAKLHDGGDVVVKVQRPGIEKVMRGDLDLLYLGARILEATIDEMVLFGPSEIVIEFEKALMRELNFNVELANLIEGRKLIDPERNITAPVPYPDVSCRTVLTMEFFDGRPLRTLEPHSAEAGRAVEELFHMACKQVFIDGFFHGDPHAGNILINDEGRICVIDWGLVGRLTMAERDDLITLAIAVITNDIDTIARILLRMGTPTKRVNLNEFKADITRFRNEHLLVATLGEADTSRFVMDFVAAAQKYRVRLATQYSVMAKSSATVEGIMRHLAPEAPLVDIARSYIEPLVKARYTPQKLAEEAFSGVTGVGSMVRHLPGQIDQLLHDMETGNFQVKAVTPGIKQLDPVVRRLGGRIALSLFAASLTISAAIILTNDPTTYYFVPILSLMIISVATGTWTVLLWWHFLKFKGPLRIGRWLKFFRRRS